jgi:hypothetical protein
MSALYTIVTIDFFNLSRKVFNHFPEPTDQSSFRGVQIHHQNWSSVLRSRVNRLLNLTNCVSLNRKIVFSIENSYSQSQFNWCRWSSFRVSSRYFNHFLEPLKGLLTFLYMRSGPSCLNGKMFSNSMFRLVINYLWLRSYVLCWKYFHPA